MKLQRKKLYIVMFLIVCLSPLTQVQAADDVYGVLPGETYYFENITFEYTNNTVSGNISITFWITLNEVNDSSIPYLNYSIDFDADTEAITGDQMTEKFGHNASYWEGGDGTVFDDEGGIKKNWDLILNFFELFQITVIKCRMNNDDTDLEHDQTSVDNEVDGSIRYSEENYVLDEKGVLQSYYKLSDFKNGTDSTQDYTSILKYNYVKLEEENKEFPTYGTVLITIVTTLAVTAIIMKIKKNLNNNQ